MKEANIYLCGVGGQGIGMLSEVLIRACMEAGYDVMGCDTHGLAQRGGVVQSHLRIGEHIYTPLVPDGEADIVIALERLEAMRGALEMLREGGSVIYYNTTYQPMRVRSGAMQYPSQSDVEETVKKLNGNLHAVELEGLPDPRMQNVALLGRLAELELIEGLNAAVIRSVLKSVLPEHVLEKNLEVFSRASNS